MANCLGDSKECEATQLDKEHQKVRSSKSSQHSVTFSISATQLKVPRRVWMVSLGHCHASYLHLPPILEGSSQDVTIGFPL